MPIYMRLAKQRGPYSKDAMPMGPHRTHTVPVNVRDLERVFDDGAEATLEAMVEKGLIKNTRTDVKVLGQRRADEEARRHRALLLGQRAREDREGRRHRDRASPAASEAKKRRRKAAVSEPAEEPEAQEPEAEESEEQPEKPLKRRQRRSRCSPG